MFLDDKTFKTVIHFSPLVSIDLLVENEEGKILLGKRINKPAQNFWFVPGGRIFKDESLESAFLRISNSELNKKIAISQASFVGIFEHFYPDNFFDLDFSTHYIVLGYKIRVGFEIDILPEIQHSHARWFDVKEIVNSPAVHNNTKYYFK